MNYLSLDFVGFVAAAFLLYYIMPKKLRWGVLLLASLGFYGLFGLRYLPFLLFAGLSTYGTALLVEKSKLKGLWVYLCVLANVAVWFCIKELPWLLTMLDIPVTFSVLVPVGISYFTLQAIAYLADVAKGKVQASSSLFGALCTHFTRSSAPSPTPFVGKSRDQRCPRRYRAGR